MPGRPSGGRPSGGRQDSLTLLNGTVAPFDEAFARQRGAHVVATFDAARTTDAQLAQTARRPGVQAPAGPFGQVILEVSMDWHGHPAGPLTVVGRADPAGPVDRVELLVGALGHRPRRDRHQSGPRQ